MGIGRIVREDPWALDAITFKMILMGKSKTDQTDYIGFIKQVPILKDLSEDAVRDMSGCLKELEYPADANIICEGDEGSNFYIIREGEVKCTNDPCRQLRACVLARCADAGLVDQYKSFPKRMK